jgi:drug/metabolite transporter (DMT)-like permease
VWLLANAPIAKVSTYAYVNPVIAIALGILVLDESLTVRIVVGALLILAAVAIVLQRESALQTGEVVGANRDPR